MKRFSFENIVKVGLALFVLVISLQNRDLFSLFGTRLFPPRLVLITLIIFSAIYVLAGWVRAKGFRGTLMKSLLGIWEDQPFRFLLILWFIRAISIRESLNLKASLSLISFFTSMIALYLILRFLRSKEHIFISRLFNLYLVGVILTGLYGFVQTILSLFGVNLPGVLVGSTFIRVPSTFYDANHLPPFLLTGIPLLLVNAFGEQRVKFRFVFYFLVAVLSLVVFLTFSRSGLLAFFVAFTTFTIYFIRRRYWRKIIFLAAASIAIFLMIYISSRTTFSLVKRISSIIDVGDRSTVAHALLLYGGFEVWQKSPIFGVGYGGFSEAFRETQSGKQHAFFDPATQVRSPIHSLWLETLAETGIVGFIAYLSFMIVIFEKFLIAFRSASNPRMKLSLVALLASFLAILSGGVFYSYNLEFFWFFLFYFYLFCDISLKERKSEARQQFDKTGESINWGELWPILLLAAISLPIFTYNLSYPLLSSGQEGLFATISKTIRRSGGMGWPLWWVPKFEEQFFFGRPPIFFYLNALNVFLYDISTAAMRFWSAIFGFLSLIFLYSLVRLKSGNIKLALSAALILMALPPFPLIARRGTLDSFAVLSSVIVGLAFWFSQMNPINYILLGLSLSFISVIDQKVFFVLGAFLVLALLADLFLRHRAKYHKSPWILSVPFLILIANWPWVSYAVGNFGQDFVYKYFSVTRSEVLTIALLLILPWLAFLFARRFHRINSLKLLKIFVTAAVIQILVVPQSGHKSYIDLINKRLELDRRGTIPLVVQTSESEEFMYYSEVPLVFVSENEIDDYLLSDRAYFLIMDGNSFRRRYDGLVPKGINARLVSADEHIVLVEKIGRVP